MAKTSTAAQVAQDGAEHFGEAFDAARVRAKQDLHQHTTNVMRSARRVSEGSARIHDALKVLHKLIADDTDHDEARAVLELLQAGSLELCSQTFQLGGEAFASVELLALHERKAS